MDSQTLDTLAALEAANEQMEVDNDDEAETQGQAQSETQPVQATETVSHSKRTKSLVWNHFVVVGVEADGKRRSRCIHCSKKLVSESASGTSSLKRHLEICPKKPPSSGDREYDPKVDRDMISEIIIFHDQPFKYVEYEKVRARDKYLNPKCQHISRQTANAYFLQVWKIERLLMKYASCDDPVMKEMAKKMRVKFSKYWDEYSLVLAMGAVLDPRLKLQILRTAYDKVDPRNAEKKVEIVKKNLKKLYEEYGAKFQSSSSTSSLEDDLNYDLFELERSIQPGLDNKKTNLEMYLEDPRLDTRSFTDIEVLGYWKDQGQRYGDLASLACDLLSIPITTVASESAFSVGGRVISPYRNRLLPKNVQALLCTRNWLRGFAEFEGDVEDYFDEDNLDKDPTTTTSSSAI
ncbi:zinc finger BED domain-containing protein DAYSLEEPER isoform X2 [Brassica napus]|uniref:zinc finger BED domain-containing protein DAYSLEEPER isoform X2 n=1 Tax=Brassica napus TaxID=3708 RepID=UPI002078E677|nr:zinc finger BED domain-containing protein DAYSLEEPER isoform X2 [Brassica napus]